MRAFVFVGPTLRADQLPAIPGLVALPPVAQGDVWRAAQQRPRAIAIIDGYFHGVLAVWHKEILWAMAQGIHVLGSASMGALRAAELHDFGMQGVGRIFEAYRTGTFAPYQEPFEDDDEVAVIHGPAETGYVALSEAMVNIRATLAEAARAGVIDASARDALAAQAKDLFYHDRRYGRLLELAAATLPADRIAALTAWLPQRRIDQKRLDALAMLDAMRTLLDDGVPATRVTYELAWTEMWDDATRTAAGTPLGDDWLPAERVLEELRLDPAAYAAVRDRSLLRFLARREAERRRQPIATPARRAELDRLRTRHGLLRRADLERWLATNDLDAQRLEQLIAEEAHLRGLSREALAGQADLLLDDLRLHGDYARIALRARDKQARLAALGLDRPGPDDIGVAPAVVLAWYFERRLGQPLPDDLDRAALEVGYDSRDHFTRALLREWLYCRETAPPQR